jgi:hypothetical protein
MERVAFQRHQGCRSGGYRILAGRAPDGKSRVCGEQLRRHLAAPGGKEPVEVRCVLSGGIGAAGGTRKRVGHKSGILEYDELPAAHDILVQGRKGLLGEVPGVDDHDGVELLKGGPVGGEHRHVVMGLDLLQNRWALLA